VVAQKLAQRWSPEQISGWLAQQHPTELSMTISHETIYRSLYIQTRGVLKKELQAHLRRHRVMRRSKTSSKTNKKTGSIQNEISIAERPQEIDSRTVPGHWEGDLISGSGNTHIATLVERSSRFVLLVKVDGKDAPTVHRALKKRLRRLPTEVRKSLTWDRGSELSKHRELSVAADLDIYFCDPASPWQRGTNENTNGLLRQYMPKKTNLGVYSQAQLSKIAKELNGRPRKTLGFRTPAEVFNEVLH
jgi:IS30 family transposase